MCLACPARMVSMAWMVFPALMLKTLHQTPHPSKAASTARTDLKARLDLMADLDLVVCSALPAAMAFPVTMVNPANLVNKVLLDLPATLVISDHLVNVVKTVATPSADQDPKDLLVKLALLASKATKATMEDKDLKAHKVLLALKDLVVRLVRPDLVVRKVLKDVPEMMPSIARARNAVVMMPSVVAAAVVLVATTALKCDKKVHKVRWIV